MIKLINEWKYPYGFDYDSWKTTEPHSYDSDVRPSDYEIIPYRAQADVKVAVEEFVDREYDDDEEDEYETVVGECSDFEIYNRKRMNLADFREYVRENIRDFVISECEKDDMTFIDFINVKIDCDGYIDGYPDDEYIDIDTIK